MTDARIVLTGCSGGGKSTLLEEMRSRGWSCVEEPGRRIVRSGGPLPWEDPTGFASRAIEVACDDFGKAADRTVLFDRSALDALVWFERTNTPLEPHIRERVLTLGYAKSVFVAPPWPELFENDPERRHDLNEALAEFEALCERLPHYGFDLHELPRLPVPARADHWEAALRTLQR